MSGSARTSTRDAFFPTDSPLRFLWGYVRRRALAHVALASCISVAALCAVAVQYGMKLIVDTMSTGDRQGEQIWYWLGLFIVLIAVESGLWRVGGWLGCRTIVATGVDVRLDLFRHMAGHPMQYFATHLAGSLGGRITATAGATGAVFSALTWKILPPIVDFFGAMIVLTTIDGHMASLLVAFASLLSVGILRFGFRGRPLHQEYARAASQVNGELVDVVANIWTVKAFSATQREYRRLQELFGTEAQAQRRSWFYLEKARALHDLFLWVMAGSMLAWAVFAWRGQRITSGDVVVISALSFRILHGSRDLALALVDAAQQVGVIAEMLRVVAVRHTVADIPGAAPFEPRAGAISLRHVDYAHAGGELALRDLNLEIRAGERCGIVGMSAAGKSTLLGLMQRLDDPSRGSVRVDDQDVAKVQQSSLRAAIAVVPQDISLLHRSVKDNIRYGRPHATDEEVVEAARHACCDEFIRELPEGYDTIVGERGARFSGGQRQRIGIARAFIKQAPILLLDEATSALDSESEQTIAQALDRLMRGRTVVAVAHRLSTVAGFDRIVVMDGGRIVEDGTPSELLSAGGLYARLWQIQSDDRDPT